MEKSLRRIDRRLTLLASQVSQAGYYDGRPSR